MVKTESISIISELKRVLAIEASALTQSQAQIEQDHVTWESAIRALLACTQSGGRIVLSGVGKSGKIAQKISATLASTGSPSLFLHPTEALHGDLGILGTQDVVVCISYTGNTEELLKIVPALRERKLKLIALTGNSESKLALQCDWTLLCHVAEEACPHNLAPTTSTTLALALGDAIAVTLMKLSGFKSDHFKANHPGGSLGARLSRTVGELMRPASRIQPVTAEATIELVIEQLSIQRLGAIPVCHENQLIGLITDGDLRRALQDQKKFFSMKARDLMTKSPETCGESTLAIDALKQMEQRASQISVLPVTDAKSGIFKGMIRIHDLLQAF